VDGRSVSRAGDLDPAPDARATSGDGDPANRTTMYAGIGVLLAAATGLALGFHRREAAHRRAVGTPGALRVDRTRSEVDVRNALLGALAAGTVRARGSDCRSLQTVVKVAAHEGLEVRDPDGFVVAATHRLARAYGSEPERKRLPLRWSVEVTEPTVSVPSGYEYLLERTGPDEAGRRLAFAPGTELLLWDGGCL